MENGITFLRHRLIASLLCSFAFVAPSRAQVDQADPCSAMVARMSHSQRVHSTLYEFHTHKDLCRLAKNAAENEPVEVNVIEMRDFNAVADARTPPPPQYPDSYLQLIAHSADAVVLGVLKSKSSWITKDRDFIFTDYQMEVEEVLKDNPAAPVRIGAEITVTRPGGTLEISGREVRAVVGSFKPFQLGGKYVLFLEYVRATGAYRAHAEESFQLLPEGAAKLTVNPAVNLAESQGDAQRFLNEVRAAVGLLR